MSELEMLPGAAKTHSYHLGLDRRCRDRVQAITLETPGLHLDAHSVPLGIPWARHGGFREARGVPNETKWAPGALLATLPNLAKTVCFYAF